MKLPASLAFFLAFPLFLGAWEPVNVPTANDLPASVPVWLRCFVRVPDEMVTPAEKDLWRDSMTLSLGGIDGPFSVWLNGQKIAESGALAEGTRRRFKVPKGLLELKAFNVFSLRLESPAKRMSTAPIFASVFDIFFK